MKVTHQIEDTLSKKFAEEKKSWTQTVVLALAKNLQANKSEPSPPSETYSHDHAGMSKVLETVCEEHREDRKLFDQRLSAIEKRNDMCWQEVRSEVTCMMGEMHTKFVDKSEGFRLVLLQEVVNDVQRDSLGVEAKLLSKLTETINECLMAAMPAAERVAQGNSHEAVSYPSSVCSEYGTILADENLVEHEADFSLASARGDATQTHSSSPPAAKTRTGRLSQKR